MLEALFTDVTGPRAEEHFWTGEFDLCPILRRYHNTSRYILLLPDQHLSDPEVRREADNFLPKDNHSLTLIFWLGPTDQAPPDSGGRIFISPKDLESLNAIAELDVPARRLRLARFLIERQRRPQLNPYQVQHPAQRRMFYDRAQDIDYLLEAESYRAIVGPRRIGKSSLAEAFHHRLAENPSRYVQVSEGGRPVFPSAIIRCLDLTPEGDGFWGEAYDQIGQTSRDRAEGRLHALTDPLKRQYRRLNAYESFLKLTTHQYKRPFLILDEVDRLIELDRVLKWSFFKQLKGWADKVAADLVLVGYRQLFEALRDDTFPFFQTCAICSLSTLPEEDAVALIREPLEELGFVLEDGVDRTVYAVTGGAPAQVQGLCGELVKGVGASNRITKVQLRQAVRASNTLQVAYDNLRSDLNGMSLLIVLLYVREEFPELRASQSASLLLDEDDLLDLVEVVAKLGSTKSLKTAKYADMVEEVLGPESEGLIWMPVFRAALDDLVLRNVLRLSSKYIEYRPVAFYALAKLLSETQGARLEKEILESRREVIGL